MKTLLAILLASGTVLVSTASFADSGDGPQFGVPQPVPALRAAGPEVFDQSGGGGFLPAYGNEAPLQTANSAPPGFGVDTSQLAAGAAGFPHYAFGFPASPRYARR